MNKLILSIIVFIFIFSGCGKEKEVITFQGLVGGIDEETLILRSDITVLGTVSEVKKSQWRYPEKEKITGGNILYTDISVGIATVLDGEPSSDTVTVRINKGEDENYIIKSDGYPDFYEGEKVLLFLSRDDGQYKTDEDYYVLTGMYQGKFTSKDGERYENRYKQNSYPSHTFMLSELPRKIEFLHSEYPDYKEEQEQKKLETIENNKKLFGE